jgi:membrane associated rhomboid family serine protease
MIIPVGHEQTTVRRLPWVTFTIMGLCTVVFVFTLFAGSGAERAAGEGFMVALEYFFEHPYLELPDRLLKFIEHQYGEEETAAQIESLREVGPEPPTSSKVLEEEQRHLDELAAKVSEALNQSPIWRWGLVPANFHVLTVISHQFLHGGWLHLFGNLFLLYLVGPFIEDVWGRPLYAVFYLVAGSVAGLMFMFRYPELDAPLVGASGAIAGVMGAFLIRYWSTKIRFIYWFFILVHGTFEAPAWLMLPLWLFK